MTEEFAPGIPAARTVQPVPAQKAPSSWEFALHHHVADIAGEHFDMRLGDAAGHAHSWAMRYWPKPGEVRLAVQQPTHTRAYMDFEGEITDGYGKGQVDLARREKAEVLESTPDRIRFNLYPGREVEEYVLRRTGTKNWMLQNITRSRDQGPGAKLPAHKPKYRETTLAKVDVTNPETVLQAKLDGAHVVYDFGAEGQSPRVFSYRTSKLSPTRLIHHTPRVPDMVGQRTPKGLAGAVLRGELVAQGQDGRALPAAQTGGMLNAGVWKSRVMQRAQGEIKPYAFDVERWNGRDVSSLPFREKSKLLQRAQQLAPWLKSPRTATTPQAKAKLVADVTRGHEPSTEEGVIEWHQDKAVPAKAKIQRERDVYVRKVFAETGKREGLAGGFEFSLTPTGPIVGRVGTGMSHDLKRDLADNPDRYIGLKAKILTTPAPESYAPRAPVFAGWHMEQDMAESTKMADLAKMAWAAGVKVAVSINEAGRARLEKRLQGREGAWHSMQRAAGDNGGDVRRAQRALGTIGNVRKRMAHTAVGGTVVQRAPKAPSVAAGAANAVASYAKTTVRPGLGGAIARRAESSSTSGGGLKRKLGIGAALGVGALALAHRRNQDQKQAA